jgi:hypothetical protein
VKTKKFFSNGFKLMACLFFFVGAFFFTTCSMAEEAPGSARAAAPVADETGGIPLKFTLGGYLRESMSINLQNPPELKKNAGGEISMLRSQAQLEASLSKGDMKLYAVGRWAREWQSPYLKDLEKLQIANGGGGHLMETLYDTDFELREAWFEFNLGEFGLGKRTTIRAGKQQVVWGETDFFQAMDKLQGFDFRWRSFLEGENEDYRKPIVFVNTSIQVPELKGTFQIVLRPGLDRDQDIGNTYDLSGGRWALQPNKGVDFISVLVPYNFRQSAGNTRDFTGGVRWSGSIADINYNLIYMRTFGPDPVVNSAFVPYKSRPIGVLGEFIYPKLDIFGVTASANPKFLDAVISTEIAYTKDQLINVGSHFLGGALPGFGGIEEKDTVRIMLRMDKPLYLSKLLGTNRASFFSIQAFDTWVPKWRSSEDLVSLAGFDGKMKQHSILITGILGLNYFSDRVNPQIAAGWDASYGGAFFIPSIAFAYGNHWRFNVEADLFFPTNERRPGALIDHTHTIGYFANNDQFYMRLTYQF